MLVGNTEKESVMVYLMVKKKMVCLLLAGCFMFGLVPIALADEISDTS